MNKENRQAIIFFASYAVIFALCVLMIGSNPHWSLGGVVFGIVWGLLCFPGLIIIFTVVTNQKQR